MAGNFPKYSETFQSAEKLQRFGNFPEFLKTFWGFGKHFIVSRNLSWCSKSYPVAKNFSKVLEIVKGVHKISRVSINFFFKLGFLVAFFTLPRKKFRQALYGFLGGFSNSGIELDGACLSRIRR